MLIPRLVFTSDFGAAALIKTPLLIVKLRFWLLVFDLAMLHQISNANARYLLCFNEIRLSFVKEIRVGLGSVEEVLVVVDYTRIEHFPDVLR